MTISIWSSYPLLVNKSSAFLSISCVPHIITPTTFKLWVEKWQEKQTSPFESEWTAVIIVLKAAIYGVRNLLDDVMSLR